MFNIRGRFPRGFRSIKAFEEEISQCQKRRTNHLNHSTWDCKYHVVFTPKYRKKVLYGHLRKELREVFHRLSRQKACEIVQGHLMPDHIHMLVSIPPKHAALYVIGFMKGENLIWIAQNIKNRKRNFAGHKFWCGDISPQQWGLMKRPSKPIFRIRKNRTSGWNDLFNR